MKVLIIDNYDSFTFNLYQYVGELLQFHEKDFFLEVFRNDEITIAEIKKKMYDRIVISPGSGDPSDKKYFGICSDVLTRIGQKTPILGVCLGMQGMAYAFGGKVVKAKLPMHGKASAISHNGKGVFLGIPQHIQAMRYHSLVVEKLTLPDCLEVSAMSEDSQEIMGLSHKGFPIEGIQFHPESFATEAGKNILANFLFSNVIAPVN